MLVKQAIKKLVPIAIKRRLHNFLGKTKQKIKPVRWGTLRTTRPISSVFGCDRGTPIDRYYMENFLAEHSSCIRGRVLEIAENTYTKKFGGAQVTKSDILHVTNDNPQATIIADLTNADHIPSDQFDCIILTQTIQVIYDKDSAVKTIYRILKPGGTVLVTASGISRISSYDMERWGEYWRFTTLSAKKLFANYFPEKNICVESHGNVLVATAFLHGLAVEDLKQKELDYNDPNYQVLITLKATK